MSETEKKKSSPIIPKPNRITRTPSKKDPDSSSPLQNRRLSKDRSPISVESKPVERRTSINALTKQQKPVKESEMQTQLNQLQEDLKTAREKLTSSEKERDKILQDLDETKKLNGDVSEKLDEALSAQKRAEESSHLEKFRAEEVEQVALEAAQKKEEEGRKEIQSLQNQHAMDIAVLTSKTQELQRAKHGLSIELEAKNAALSHAEDAMKIAEINTEKVELLSGEVNRLKMLIESKSQNMAKKTEELIKTLHYEIETLKEEIERAERSQDKLIEMEEIGRVLKREIIEVKAAESDFNNTANGWKQKIDLLDDEVSQAALAERSASDSLCSSMKQLEGNRVLLQESETEVHSLRDRIESLEIALVKYKGDIESSYQYLETAKQEGGEMAKTIKSLKSELRGVEEEKRRALSSEKFSASSIQLLLQERNKMLDELEATKYQSEKSKKAMQSLSSALDEVSMNGLDVKEKLSMHPDELEDAKYRMEDLKLMIEASEERYMLKLDEMKEKIVCLDSMVERSKIQLENSMVESKEKEQTYVDSLKKSAEEMNELKQKVDKLITSLKKVEEEGRDAKENRCHLLNALTEVETKLTSVKQVAEESKNENRRLKESLLDKENEIQSIFQENEDLLARESAILCKVEALTSLLLKYSTKINGVPLGFQSTDDISTENINDNETEGSEHETTAICSEEDDTNRKARICSGDSDAKFNLKTGEKEEFTEHKNHPSEDISENECDKRSEEKNSNGFDQMDKFCSESIENGGSSPNKQDQKKKKPLLHKFGSMLKKKNNPK